MQSNFSHRASEGSPIMEGPFSTGPSEVVNSDSKNSLSSSSYESASSALSECGDPASLNGSPLHGQLVGNSILDTDTETEEEADDGHHSDTCGTSGSNGGGLDTTSPETTNSTGDSSYNTYPYVSIRKYASALDLSQPIDLSGNGCGIPAGSMMGPNGEVTKMSDASTCTSVGPSHEHVDYSISSHSQYPNMVSFRFCNCFNLLLTLSLKQATGALAHPSGSHQHALVSYSVLGHHPYTISLPPSAYNQQQLQSLESNPSTGSLTTQSPAVKETKATNITQTSSLPSSRRPSTNLTPSQMAAAMAHVPQRVFIRVPVKDIAIQTDFPEDHSLMSGSSASSSSTSSVRDHSDIVDQTTTTTTSTLTAHDHLNLNQLSLREQQHLLQQAVQQVLLGLQQNMSMFSSQLASSQIPQQLGHHPDLKQNRSVSVDHSNPAILQAQVASPAIAHVQSRLPADHSATISACASDKYQSELHSQHQQAPYGHILPPMALSQQHGIPGAPSFVDNSQPAWSHSGAFVSNTSAVQQLALMAVNHLVEQVRSVSVGILACQTNCSFLSNLDCWSWFVHSDGATIGAVTPF